MKNLMKSNRLMILTALFSLFCLASFGQGPGKKEKVLKTKFGLKAGVNLANIKNGQTSLNFSPGMKTDFQAGAMLNMHFGKRIEGSPVGTGKFGIQPELLYSRQGFTVNGESINLDFVTLPVMAKYYMTEKFNIGVGPYVGYLLSSAPNSSVIDGAQINLSDLKGSIDVGMGAGIGYETTFGLSVEARYNLGMSDMAKNLKWQNNVIAFSLGWLF